MTTVRRSGRPARWIAVLAITTAGCSGAGVEQDSVDPETALRFSYERAGEPGFLDQVMAIENTTDHPVVLDGAYEALDETSEPLPDVETASLYGSERMEQVLLPGETVDVLRFEGSDVDRVADVRVVDTEARKVAFPDVDQLVDALPAGERGQAVADPRAAVKVDLQNPNAADVTVAVVCVVWDVPEEGRAQQALQTWTVADSVTVPDSGSTVVDIPESVRDEVAGHSDAHPVSLKAYFVPAE